MKQLLLLSVLFILSIGFVSYRVTHALFSDTAKSTDNKFIASQSFTTPTPIPTSMPTQTPTPTPTPTPITVGAGDVIINEIMWAGSSKSTADEWIELKNTTSNTIDLSNWTIEKLASGSSSLIIPSGKTILPNGLFLIANFAETSPKSILNITPDIVDNDINLTNDGEQLILKTNTSTIIDTANIDDDWFAGETSGSGNPKKSMERNSTPGDGTISTNWHTATTSTNLDAGVTDLATPKAANSL